MPVAVVLVVSMLVLLLGGCYHVDRSYQLTAPPEHAGAWRILHRIDRITGQASPTALIDTFVSNNKLDDTDIRDAQLQLLCFKNQPVVRLEFSLKVGANRSASLAYRVDDVPGSEVEVTFLQDFRTVMIDDQAVVGKFLADIANGKVLLVRVNSLYAGRTFAEFRIAGAAAALAPVVAQCPVGGAPAPPKRTSANDLDDESGAVLHLSPAGRGRTAKRSG